MPRMTRAKAAEVAEQLHVDQDAVLEMPSEDGGVDLKAIKTPEPSERAALGELAPNSGGKSAEEDQVAGLRKSTRGKKGASKGQKQECEEPTASSTTSQPLDQGQLPEAFQDDEEAGSSPASEKAAEETKTLPFAAVRLTTSQNAKDAENAEQPEQELRTSEAEPSETVSTSLHQAPETSERADEPATQIFVDEPTSPIASAMPSVIWQLRRDTPGKRSTSNKENVEPMETNAINARPTNTPRSPSTYDALEAAVIEAATPPASLSRRPSSAMVQPEAPEAPEAPESVSMDKEPEESTPAPEDPITALDALDEAVEAVVASVPELQAVPEDLKVEKPAKAQKPAPVVRATKASQARISLAHGGDISSLRTSTIGKPRPSTTLGRSSSVKAATKRGPSGSNASPNTVRGVQEKKETVIPHSKPRPVSLSFPTPPPPPKSSKAPTKSTFQLPGEAVAAKLKAAREERLKKEAEDDAKKSAFKARPVPASLKIAPSVRQTSTSKARESLMGPSKPTPAPSAAKSHKRASSVATTTLSKPRTVSKELPANAAINRLSVSRQRPSTALANTSKPRASLPSTSTAPSASTPSTTSQRVPSKGTAKGKEVFHRAAAAKEAAEKEKREKEEAAKKARAAAAERSRLLSREWAEKRKMKKAGVKEEVGKQEEGSGEGAAVAVAVEAGGAA